MAEDQSQTRAIDFEKMEKMEKMEEAQLDTVGLSGVALPPNLKAPADVYGEPETSAEADEKKDEASAETAAGAATTGPPQAPIGLRPEDFPDGGLEAWLCVFGAWCALFATFGLANCVGVFETYYVEGPLASYGESAVSWIISVMLAIEYGSAYGWGRLFGAHGPRWLLFGDSIAYIFGLMMTSLGTQYYQIFLALSVLASVGNGAVFNISFACCTTWFFRKRAAAMGIAASGASFGGVILPVIFNQLTPTLGFPWALRISAFLCMGLLVITCLTVKSRLAPRPKAFDAKDLLRPFKQATFVLTSLAAFFFIWGLFLPFNYITLQAKAAGVNANMAQYILCILNAVSTFGRIIPGIIADKIGRYNMTIIISAISGIITLAIWIPGAHSFAGIIVYGAIFGFTSGGYVSLAPTCISQISDLREIGTRMGLTFLIMALAALTGSPIGGALVAQMDGDYLGLQLFCGLTMCMSVAFFIAARYLQVGFRLVKV